MNKFEKAVGLLLKNEPYYAYFIINSKIKFVDVPFGEQPSLEEESSKSSVPNTAWASVENGTLVLGFNHQFLNTLSDQEVCAVLKHEVLHLLFKHVDKLSKNKDKKLNAAEHRVWNVAMDIAINCYIHDIPADCWSVEKLRELTKNPNIESFQTAEYYHNILMQDKDVQNICDQFELVDSHGENNDEQEGSGSSELSKAVIGRVVKKAMDDSKGNIPGDLAQVLNDIFSESKLKWKQILRNFVARSTNRVVISTKKKVHRRFDLEQPGKRKLKELVLGVCFDSSGSISDKNYEDFFNEIKAIAPNTSKTYLIEADCKVQNVVTLKKNSVISKKRAGYGGTAYQPALDECKRLKCDAIIYFGDMDVSDTPENPGIPVLWVTVGSTNKPGNFGHIVAL